MFFIIMYSNQDLPQSELQYSRPAEMFVALWEDSWDNVSANTSVAIYWLSHCEIQTFQDIHDESKTQNYIGQRRYILLVSNKNNKKDDLQSNFSD